MNPQIPIEARQTVLDFVTAGTAFTAYEVTLEVRRRLGTSIDVPHSAVLSIVRTMFSRGEIMGYDRLPDQTVQSATPPFRYYQQGGGVAAPFVAPTAPAISRSSLPAVLRDVSFSSLLRAYSFSVNGFSDEPFAITLPNRQAPTLRFRCYGAAWPQSEIERVFTLDVNASNKELRWLTALGYGNEFRVYSNNAGTQQQFLVTLNSATQTTLTKEVERATGEPDGLEIEIAVKPNDVDRYLYGDELLLRHLAVAPGIYKDGKLLNIEPFETLLQGDGWELLERDSGTKVIVEGVPYSLPGYQEASPLYSSTFRLNLAIAGTGESYSGKLKKSPQTQGAIEAAIAKVEAEFPAIFNRKMENAPTIWDAKIIYAQVVEAISRPDDDDDDESSTHISRLVSGEFSWRGIAIKDAKFNWPANLSGVTVRRYTPTRNGDKVSVRVVSDITAVSNAQVFEDDVNGKALTRRLQTLHEATPIQVVYVLSFEDEAARANFFRETNFETVPTRPISQLPQPASQPRAPHASNRKPFDAQLHQPAAPAGALAAAFADGNGGSDDDFAKLKTWARTAPLDGTNWPDFKRTYKAIEARLWPPMGRFRWDKTEADFPATPIPSERDLELLGVLMGRLDEIDASRGSGAPAAPQPTIAQRALNAIGGLIGRAQSNEQTGPSDDTLAYMKRRATKLLRFLRDKQTLSSERRNALAPLVCGLLQRDKCADISATLPLRLKLGETDVLAAHPAAIARVWADASLPIKIARWSYNWLDAREQTVAVSPTQLRRFAELPDAEMTFKLAPAALQSGEKWLSDFDLKKFSQILQGQLKGQNARTQQSNTAFLARRGEITYLFARFPQLEVEEDWLRNSLGEVSDEVTLDWLAPWLNGWAQKGVFELLPKMSGALQSRFNAAIIAVHPHGFSPQRWRELSDSPALLPLLSPTLRQLPISSEVADFIWALPAAKRDPILSALEDNPALLPIIETHARALDWGFIAPLSAGQWEQFARIVSQTFPQGIGADEWAKIAQLPFESGHQQLPLGAGFWTFVLPLETEARTQWIARVGAERAAGDFAAQSATVFEQLLDSDATGLDKLGDAWLDAHLSEIPRDGELIVKLAQSAISDWQARALSHLQSAELRLPVALRFMESELPILERVAAPFFSDESKDWSDRILALADSPKLAARALALQLLEEFPSRWTPNLLRNLAQHDDGGVQAFVANQLEKAPTKVVESKAIEAFDTAILNARGRARRAKESVKSRVSESEFDNETLLEAARNGAPRDREWALQQLVRASLAGESIEGLKVEGAFKLGE